MKLAHCVPFICVSHSLQWTVSWKIAFFFLFPPHFHVFRPGVLREPPRLYALTPWKCLQNYYSKNKSNHIVPCCLAMVQLSVTGSLLSCLAFHPHCLSFPSSPLSIPHKPEHSALWPNSLYFPVHCKHSCFCLWYSSYTECPPPSSHCKGHCFT